MTQKSSSADKYWVSRNTSSGDELLDDASSPVGVKGLLHHHKSHVQTSPTTQSDKPLPKANNLHHHPSPTPPDEIFTEDDGTRTERTLAATSTASFSNPGSEEQLKQIIREGIKASMRGSSREASPMASLRLASSGEGGRMGLPFDDIATQTEQHFLGLFQDLTACSNRGALLCDVKTQRIIHVNEMGMRLLGRLDLIGKHVNEVLPHDIRAGHAERMESYQERYVAEYRKSGTALASRLVDDPSERLVRMTQVVDGREQLFEASIHLHTTRLPFESISQPPRIMTLEFEDIGTMQQDSSSVKVMKSILSQVSEGVVIADLEGKIEWMNEAAEVLSGFTLKSLTDRHATVSTFVDPSFFDRHESYLRNFHSKRAAAMTDSKVCTESVQEILTRRDRMRTAHGSEQIQLRVEVVYNKLIGYFKSTKEFIPREEFETERLKLLLPAPVVRLIQADPNKAMTDRTWEFPRATVLVTDVKGFSTWAREQPVRIVHDRMQPMFSNFEQIINEFGGELIHRIGDAVMAVFGFSGESHHHARLAVACATELQLWASQNDFRVRLGLHSGPICGGILGSDRGRPAFEVWGETVDLAKQMEHHGIISAIHLSQDTVAAVGKQFRHVAEKVLRKRTTDTIVRRGGETLERFLIFINYREPETEGSVVHSESLLGLDDRHHHIPEEFVQLVNFQKVEFAKWTRKQEETAQRLAEMEKRLKRR